MTWVKGALCLGAAVAVAGPARAALIDVKVSVLNQYGGVHYAGEPRLGTGGTIYKTTSPGTWTSLAGDVINRAEYGIDYIGEASEQDGSFFFLHNNYCVGTCGTASRTVITFTIRNDGEKEEALRFDSLITPGHLARIGRGYSMEAGFDFTVTQDPEALSERELYAASGIVTDTRIGVITPDGLDLNGLRPLEAAGWTVLDWGATNLNLSLGVLGAGQTTVLRYEANYWARTGGSCLDLSECGGVQVVFGDPRTNGSGMNMRMAAPPEEPTRDVIDTQYKRFESSFAVVLDDPDTLPGDPPPMPELNYDGGSYTPGGRVEAVAADVPEPGTWGLMLLGFGAVGAAVRGRGRRGAFARA